MLTQYPGIFLPTTKIWNLNRIGQSGCVFLLRYADNGYPSSWHSLPPSLKLVSHRGKTLRWNSNYYSLETDGERERERRRKKSQDQGVNSLPYFRSSAFFVDLLLFHIAAGLSLNLNLLSPLKNEKKNGEEEKKRERERESVRERKKTREEAAAVDRSNSSSYYLRLDLGAFFLSFSMFLSLSFRWGGAIRFRLNVPSSFSLDLGRFSGWFDFAAAHVSQRLFHPLSLSFLFILSFFLSFILSFFHSLFLVCVQLDDLMETPNSFPPPCLAPSLAFPVQAFTGGLSISPASTGRSRRVDPCCWL